MRFSVAVSLMCALFAFEARAEDLAERRCRDFITHFIPVHRVETGTQVQFTGRFKPIPQELEKELKRAYPERVFRIAEMEYLHWGFDPVRLLLVLRTSFSIRDGKVVDPDPESLEVETYLWASWFTSAPFSFETGFDELQTRSTEEAKARIAALAKLVASLSDWSVCEVTIDDNVIRAPLLAKEGRIERVIRTRVGFRSISEMEWLKIEVPERSKAKAP